MKALRVALGAAVALSAFEASQAHAQGIPNPLGIYTGCYLRGIGTLRLINAPIQTCLPNIEIQVTWSQIGPLGPVGPAGATGTQGPQGPTGPQGPIGLTGATGPQGAQGVAGPQGQAGPVGPAGPQGLASPTVPICRGRPGGTCSLTTSQYCAYDTDCPSGETCSWSAGTCSVTASQSCLSNAGCPSGETCSNPRFIDNLNGTVTDWRTCLTWEKKDGTYDAVNACWGWPTCTNACPGGATCSDSHNVNNVYSWSVDTAAPYDFDGSAATAFLTALNTAAFAGHTDWRLPTDNFLYIPGNDRELTSILTPGCGIGVASSTPCIDPVFGPTAVSLYWTSSTVDSSGDQVWWVSFWGESEWSGSVPSAPLYVRAVRGGPANPR